MRFRSAGLALTTTLVVLSTLLAAEAQQASRIRRVGVLAPSPEVTALHRAHPLLVAFLQRMGELGYTEGQTVAFEGRRGPQDRLPGQRHIGGAARLSPRPR